MAKFSSLEEYFSIKMQNFKPSQFWSNVCIEDPTMNCDYVRILEWRLNHELKLQNNFGAMLYYRSSHELKLQNNFGAMLYWRSSHELKLCNNFGTALHHVMLDWGSNPTMNFLVELFHQTLIPLNECSRYLATTVWR
jgi:hypothetical protein